MEWAESIITNLVTLTIAALGVVVTIVIGFHDVPVTAGEVQIIEFFDNRWTDVTVNTANDVLFHNAFKFD